MNYNKLNRIIDSVTERLLNLTDSEFEEKLSKHKNGDFKRILLETHALDVGDIESEAFANSGRPEPATNKVNSQQKLMELAFSQAEKVAAESAAYLKAITVPDYLSKINIKTNIDLSPIYSVMRGIDITSFQSAFQADFSLIKQAISSLNAQISSTLAAMDAIYNDFRLSCEEDSIRIHKPEINPEIVKNNLLMDDNISLAA